MSNRHHLGTRTALTDTGAYYGLGVVQDNRHLDALAISRKLIAEAWQLYSTNFILAETHALYLNRVGRQAARAALSIIERSDTVVVRVTAADERRAWAIIDQYDDKDFTFTDATSFAVMERLDIATAFTFDRNFIQFGLPVLTPPLPPR